MNRELLDVAFTKLADAATLLDSAGEELLAGRAVALAERVNLRPCEDDNPPEFARLRDCGLKGFGSKLAYRLGDLRGQIF